MFNVFVQGRRDAFSLMAFTDLNGVDNGAGGGGGSSGRGYVTVSWMPYLPPMSDSRRSIRIMPPLDDGIRVPVLVLDYRVFVAFGFFITLFNALVGRR